MNFVTGGTGLVGARLIYDLVNRGEEVTALLRKGTTPEKLTNKLIHYTNNPEKITQKVIWVEGDLLNVENLLEIVPVGSTVFHCAAMVSFDPKKSHQIIKTNVEGTANMVNVCNERKVNKFCQVSSIGALGGKTDDKEITEDTVWSPVGKSAYSLSKYYSELEVWRGMAEGLNAVIVNPAVILGPGDWNQGSPQLFSEVFMGMHFYTKGSTSYIDVRDVSKAMIELTKSDLSNEKFILASETLTYQQLFNTMAAALGVKAPNIYANKFVTALAYRLEFIRSKLLGKEPKITQQTHKIVHTVDNYIGSKIMKHLDFTYIPIAESINFISGCYKKSNQTQISK